MKRIAVILCAVFAALVLVVALSGAAHGNPPPTRPTVQLTCRAGTYATWTVTNTHTGALRAVCKSGHPSPLLTGVNYGAGKVYAPTCPHGMRFALTAAGPAQDHAAAQCTKGR